MTKKILKNFIKISTAWGLVLMALTHFAQAGGVDGGKTYIPGDLSGSENGAVDGGKSIVWTGPDLSGANVACRGGIRAEGEIKLALVIKGGEWATRLSKGAINGLAVGEGDAIILSINSWGGTNAVVGRLEQISSIEMSNVECSADLSVIQTWVQAFRN